MGLLAPWFLAGGLAVGLPVWLHLLRQHKSTPLPFASLMFFEKRTQSSIKHRRLRYLLLFALRVALILLLALAFANPFVMSSGGPIAGGKRMYVFAIDDSFSMRQGGRLDRAKQQAVSALSAVGGENRGQVLSFGSSVKLMGEAAADPVALRAGVQAIQPTDERGSFAELARALRSIAQAARMPVEAHVFSDMQKSSWPANFGDARLSEGTKLVFHTVADKRLANFAAESVNAPRRVFDPKKVKVQATIVGYGTEKATKRVVLVLNGKELASKQVEVPPNGRAVAEFLTLDAPYGMSRGEIRIEPADEFPADDHVYFTVERADPRRILFVHEARNTRGLLYFRTALDASNEAAFAVDAVTVDQAGSVAPSKFALVVLSDVSSLPGDFENTLKNYVKGGGSVLVALGHMSAMKNRVPVFEEAIAESRYSSREGERFQTAADLDPSHPSIRRANQWEGVRFYQSIRVEPGKSKVIAKLSDNTPLLLEKQIGEGRAMVFASTLDNISNDFPLHSSFVPFVAETARYLGRLDDSGANFQVGAYYELRAVKDQGATIEVLDPAGKRALSLEEATKAQNIQLTSEGFYDVRRPSGHHDLVAVNADRRESDLDVLPGETLALWQNTGQAQVAAGVGGEAEKKPQSFWWYLMMAVLLLTVAETVVGNRHLAVDKEAA